VAPASGDGVCELLADYGERGNPRVKGGGLADGEAEGADAQAACGGAEFPVPLASTAAIDQHGCLAIRVIAIVGTGSIRRLCAAVRSSAQQLQ
jgi:hypothetical protein